MWGGNEEAPTGSQRVTETEQSLGQAQKGNLEAPGRGGGVALGRQEVPLHTRHPSPQGEILRPPEAERLHRRWL